VEALEAAARVVQVLGVEALEAAARVVQVLGVEALEAAARVVQVQVPVQARVQALALAQAPVPLPLWAANSPPCARSVWVYLPPAPHAPEWQFALAAKGCGGRLTWRGRA
jgi:hypothetical protein